MNYYVITDEIMGVLEYGLAEGQELPADAKLFETEKLMDAFVSEYTDKYDKKEAAEFEAQEKEAAELAEATKVITYEHRDIWAEENSSLKSNSAQFSFGNGATGYMGIPVDSGWEVVSMYFSASTYASKTSVVLDLMDYSGAAPGSAQSRTIASISLSDAKDGGGDTNNAYKYINLDVPVKLESDTTLLGFISREIKGSVGNVRVGTRLRRAIN